MNPTTQLTLLIVIAALSTLNFVGTFAQPSNGGDTAKLEADIAALSAQVTALDEKVTATNTQVTALGTAITANQNSNVAAFNEVINNASSVADGINAKLDQLLALHAVVPPPVEDSYANKVEWDYEHVDDGLGPISGFNIQRSDDGGTTWNDYVQVPGADTRSYEDRPVPLGQNKCYRVLAFRVREAGAVIDYSVAPSNVACSTSPTPPTS